MHLKPSSAPRRAAPLSRDERPLTETINVISVYDGLVGGVIAHETVEWLQRHLGSGKQVKHHWWSFGALSCVDVRAEATRVAENADMLFVAGDSDSPLPDEVWKWIDRCFQRHGRGPAALVALHEDEGAFREDEGQLTQDLRQIALLRDMEFIENQAFEERMKQGLPKAGAASARTAPDAAAPMPAIYFAVPCSALVPGAGFPSGLAFR